MRYFVDAVTQADEATKEHDSVTIIHDVLENDYRVLLDGAAEAAYAVASNRWKVVPDHTRLALGNLSRR